LLTKGIGHSEFKYSLVGRIPKAWEVKELNEIVDPLKPITYGIVQAGPHVENGVPYIRVSDMIGRELKTDGMLRTSFEIAEKFKRSSVNAGDIVYALRGVIGHVQKVPQSLDGANLTQGTARISSSNLVCTDYLLWALKSPYVAFQNDMEAKGSTFREVTLASLRAINVCVPSIEEQNKISEILDSIQNRIDTIEDKYAHFQSIKKALMQDLLTGKVRVKVN
jgi:type I restriction enzyme, S subunit